MDLTSSVFRMVAEECGSAVSLKDREGRYLWANARFTSAFAPGGGFQAGLTDSDLFPPETAQQIREHDAAVFAALGANRPVQSEQVVSQADGEHVYLVDRFPVRDDRGELGLATMAVEITQRSRAEEDILVSRALFKGILDIANDAIVSVDEHQRIVSFNQGAERIFGYAAEEMVGKPLNLLLPPEARPGHASHIAHFRKAPEASRQMGERGQIYGCRKNGEIFPAEASISRIEINGRMTYTAILRDVTRQKQTEQAIRALNADLSSRAGQLEAANRELEAFSYSVSHDLRAPLRGIDGFSQLLIEDYGDILPQAARDALDRVRNATQRMGQLIDDMLNLSRLTRGDLHRERIDISSLTRSIIGELRKSQPERAVEFVIADGMEANADPHLMQVLLGNLLGNAWKYTSKHLTARIEIGSTETADQRAAFFVKDDGAGFDMAYAHKLFGAFQRLHGMNEYPGTGIGLATVQRIVHKHGGEVWAEGAVERGATFTFTLV